jgi:hypothetical protein
MKDRSYFIEAALRYEELLESGQIISLDAFVAQNRRRYAGSCARFSNSI